MMMEARWQISPPNQIKIDALNKEIYSDAARVATLGRQVFQDQP
jgi:hypothetical protein